MTITEAEGADGSSERPPTLPGEAPAGEAPAGEGPAGEAPAGEADDDAHAAPTSAIVTIAATSLTPVPIPTSPLHLTVGTCGRLNDDHRRPVSNFRLGLLDYIAADDGSVAGIHIECDEPDVVCGFSRGLDVYDPGKSVRGRGSVEFAGIKRGV